MTMSTSERYLLKTYSVIDGGFVGNVNYCRRPSTSTHNHSDEQTLNRKRRRTATAEEIKTIIILDRSWSMGRNVELLTERILPNMLLQIGYDETAPITLITFDTTAEIYHTTVSGMAKLYLNCRGSTSMANAINLLRNEVTAAARTKTAFRLLTLSDGALDDQEETVQVASALAHLLAERNVNSRAIRYFTASSDPDTRGLASVLQFNNFSSEINGLIDMDGKTDAATMVNTMASLFKDDGLDGAAVNLTSKSENIKAYPWDQKCIDSVRLINGNNTFWFTTAPTDLTIDGVPVDIKDCGPLNFDNQEVVSIKLQRLAYRVKVLKIVNSKETVEEVTNAKAYINKWIKAMEQAEISPLGDSSTSPMRLKSRLQMVKNKVKRQAKSIFYQLAEIVNDDKVQALNSAQQAAYLRSLDSGKLSKALARRAAGSGLDFDAVVRQEVMNMVKNLPQLDNVDDSNHFPSFYSYATTLAGIKAVCELGDSIDTVDAMDVLQLINVVGIACQSTCGDYPDPMIWLIGKMFPGTFISVSDLIAAFEQSGAGKQYITVPQTSERITAVVPYFEDKRIQQFLQKNAPNMLDYICSIGMRNILAGVPKTYLYTLISGIWKLTQDIDENKLEVAIVACQNLMRSLDIAAGNVFRDIMDCIKKEQPPVDGKLMSFYLANNGIINIIGPMISLAKENNLITPVLPRILRALYSYEIYLALRKFLKKEDATASADADAKIRDLFGIDFEKYGTPVGALFDDNVTDPQFHSGYYVNEQAFREIAKTFRSVDYVTLLAYLIDSLVRGGDGAVGQIKAMPKMSDASIVKALDISYSIDDFKLFNILQAFLFDSQSRRSNEEQGQMNIIDLGVKETAEQFVRDYIRTAYQDNYKRRLNAKTAKELHAMSEKLVDSLLSTEDMHEYEHLLGKGVTVKNMSHQIVNSSSPGFTELFNRLADLSKTIPCRLAKIRVLLIGRSIDSNATVWNGGNLLFVNKSLFRKAFFEMDAKEEWWDIVELYKAAVYVYRSSKRNRHKHSNDKPSYWALGYKTLQDYFDSVSPAERARYESIHVGCCGLPAARRQKPESNLTS